MAGTPTSGSPKGPLVGWATTSREPTVLQAHDYNRVTWANVSREQSSGHVWGMIMLLQGADCWLARSGKS
jgi:hypothetical protein